MRRIFIGSLAFAALGCASLRASNQAALRQRASFDLSCPAAQLQLTPLDELAVSEGAGTTGVTGCGHQATYVYQARGAGWVLNSATKQASRAE